MRHSSAEPVVVRHSVFVLSIVVLFCSTTFSQSGLPRTVPALTPAPSHALPEPPPKDPLNRTTPRDTVLAFLTATQKKDFAVAAEYLDTRAHGKAAEDLARQLSIVLDRRLPARLNQLSDKPEGSQTDPLHPDRDLVGTIRSSKVDVPIFLERIDRGKSGLVWLFSSQTLESIPELYAEIDIVSMDSVLPQFLVSTRVFGIQLFEWIAVLIGLPFLYLITVWLNRILSMLVRRLRRRLRRKEGLPNPQVISIPTRLILIALTISWLRTRVGLSLLARQFWGGASLLIVLIAVIWMAIRLNGKIEGYLHRRLRSRNLSGTASILRLARRVADLVFVFAGILVILYYFGISAAGALAGLGVGGIAVALAAQKTLENVIGGVSLIVDQVVRVGDVLKVGDTLGEVDGIGLRSTRVRTLDRTIVSIPNGQVANMSLETLSVRDKFWFHPRIGLRYETSANQIASVVRKIRLLLLGHPSVEGGSVRVRFFGFGSSSLELDTFAYVYARDWNHFLEIQESFLLSIMEIAEETDVQIALPSRLMYIADTRRSNTDSRTLMAAALQGDVAAAG